MTAEVISEARCFEGSQRTYRHDSDACGCTMQFAVYLPPAAAAANVPAIYWLSGLTCTEDNFSTKAGAQRYAAEHGVALIIPDTSPRGVELPGQDDRINVGTAAGFYINATEQPWAAHYRMFDYVAEELVDLVNRTLPVDPDRKSISGHSMGGHGALVVGLKQPNAWRAISAFAPIANASQAPWGREAFTEYLGSDPSAWEAWDACALIRSAPSPHELLVDQGLADPFLDEQLRPDALRDACRASGQKLTLREREGYDHGYYFVSTFIAEHIAFHAAALA